MDRGPRYAYVSYHKCATQYTRSVLEKVCRVHRLRPETFDARHPRVEAEALENVDFVLLTDYTTGMVDLASLDVRGLRVIRDPRDILVSMYFSHASSHPLNHPEIARDRAALADRPLQDGLRYLLEESRFYGRIIDELARWDDAGHPFFETTFERLVADPFEVFSRALDFLGLSLPPWRLRWILRRRSFDRLRKRWAAEHPGANVNHYRRGRPGDWRRHFGASIREEFERRHGDLLISLGFEPDPAG